MYTVTFYSYKGGVGRTMGLVNVAYLLAKEGKRVLVVDFDLEAPGLSTYEPFVQARTKSGVMEYVSAYIETNRAPDVSDYIVECGIEDSSVWLMPAGDFTSASYNENLHKIDWKYLYENKSGFLFFEDMKQQWAQFNKSGFDYVLIDSRTGHTDVGGICTRQLPDAVVVMFVPTPQNIDGLKPIVKAIRSEKSPVRKEKVKIHFCPSNVPDLDDEDAILRDLIDQGKKELGYSEGAALIQHYQSLALLQQPVYAAAHPKSKLARQYEDLKTSTVAGNLSDRDGALTALDLMLSRYKNARNGSDKSVLDEIVVDSAFIKNTYSEDPEIAWGLAHLANTMIRPDEEISALTVVVDSNGENVVAALLRRAVARATLNNRSGAASDIETILLEKSLTLFESRSAVELLKVFDGQGWRKTVENAAVRVDMDAWVKADLLELLLDSREVANQVADLAQLAMQADEISARMIRNIYILALVAGGNFRDAMSAILGDRGEILSSDSVQDVFNYGVSQWCFSGLVPKEIFERFLVLARNMKGMTTPNTLQCFALAKAALGQSAGALEDIESARRRVEPGAPVFSCWHYLSGDDEAMKSDLHEMQLLISENRLIVPPIQVH